jgi:hypothetical protein
VPRLGRTVETSVPARRCSRVFRDTLDFHYEFKVVVSSFKTVAVMQPRFCGMCPSTTRTLAVVFCDADACFLCAACDEQVHEANRLAQRHVRRPVSANDFQPASEDSDILVPDVDGANNDSLSRNSSGLEDADEAYADFDDFEGVAFGKMPSLNASDSDTAFLSVVPSAGLKAFDSDLSWDAVVPEEFDHVVPDVESTSMPCVGGKVPVVSTVKSEFVSFKVPMSIDATVPACPVVPMLTGRPPVVCKTSTNVHVKSEPPTISHVPCRGDSPLLLRTSGPLGFTQGGNSTSDSVMCSSSPQSPIPSTEASASTGDATDVVKDNAAEGQGGDGEAKTAWQRKQLRAEALVRFRAKRANRSFRKKIRYGCRKVLAESRPRVKGRFVKKCDMALYVLHGADYAKFKIPAVTCAYKDVAMEQVVRL